jgi:hypothetical protein
MATKSKSKKKTAPVKKTAAKKVAAKKPSRKKKPSEGERSQKLETVMLGRHDRRPRAAGQSGDMQGVSRIADADSESVDELLAEGNAYEAGIVQGIEDVPDADRGEIRTREVPEDDVPGEYRNQD